ncbi:MAG: tRNA lysidine(34) synthetase TilS [Thermaerobacter sp.]|nr:tRNA lysidine(34) synthetase TilS [Thermaerobacter sp.]
MPVEAGRHMEDLLADLRAEAERRGLRGAMCVVAVSGGPDSVALWHLLVQTAPALGLRLHLCHVDHGWRPQDAAREAALAARMAERAGVGCSIIHLPTPDRLSEEDARDHRLAVLSRVAAGLSAAAVALGHQEDDQAETVLMQLLRGSARAAGMAAWRAPFWRPLLGVPKERLIAVCREAGLAYSVDATNDSDGNLRARLRQDVMPLLRRENPRVVAAIARNAGLRAEDDQLLEEEARVMLAALPVLPGGVDIRPLRTAPGPVARRALRALLLQVGVPAPQERIAQLLAALRAGRRMSPAQGIRLEDGALWSRISRPDALSLRDGMRARFGDLWIGVGEPPAGAMSVDIPKGEVAVRGRLPGDRLHTPSGTRKLQDILVDAKVPRRVRDLVPILMIDGVPFWVPGQPWRPETALQSAREPSRTAWAAPAQVVTSLWSVLK